MHLPVPHPSHLLLALLGLASTAHGQQAGTVALSGYVFEDPSYGGGSGRPLSTTGTSPRPGATVELYDAAGGFVASTTTSGSGQYSFSASPGTSYRVRVVSGTVSSGRAGYASGLLPVQTYNGTTTRVGGENPALADAPAHSSGQSLADLTTATTTAESQAAVTTGTGDTTGPDFGFSFDVVVNTNDAGQGSLRQFVLNAGALGGEGNLAQAGSSTTTVGTTAALAAGRETSIFMIPDGQAHPGLLAAGNGGPANALTTQNGQQVAVITLLVSSGGLQITGASAGLTTVDGGTQTYNIGDTNMAALASGGTVGTSSSFSYTSFSGPEVQLLGEYAAANASTNRKPRNGFNVLADDFTLRNVAMRNFGNPGGQGAVGFDNVPGRTGTLDGYTDANGNHSGPLGPVRALLEYDVFGSDASSFTAPSAFASNEGDNGRSNQHVQYDISGTASEVNTVTVHTSLLGFSERRAIHFQGNSAITGGYNLNVAVYDNVFQAGGVGGTTLGSGPYFFSSSGAVELIQSTRPFLAVYQNRITGPGQAIQNARLGEGGSDGIEINNARVNAGQDAQSLINNERRDAGTARSGSTINQNTVQNMRLGMLCQSNITYSAYALDGLQITGNVMMGNVFGLGNQGDNHTMQGNSFSQNFQSGVYDLGSGVVFSGNTIQQNATDGMQIGETTTATSTTHPATTGVVVGPGNVFTGNGASNSSGQGLIVLKADTRVRITQNSSYANRQLAIDLNNDGITANNGTLNQSFPNQELDYPVLTSAVLANGQLTVKGYVGSATGQATFGGAVVELFVADNSPADQSGEVVAGDGQSVPHGEGRGYLATLTADGSGNFSGTFAAGSASVGALVTGTATLGSGSQTSTSEFGNDITITDQPLPVQLVAFTAQAVRQDARLAWTTASELHNDHFDVERSLDGTGFVKIGQVAGQGSKASSTNYAYTDAGAGASALAGQPVYYRLHQVDTDGTASYSPVRAVSFTGTQALALYPNPTTGAATLDLSALPAEASCQLLLLDATGRQVRRISLPGGTTQPLDLHELAAGLYQAQLSISLPNGTLSQQSLRVQKQ